MSEALLSVRGVDTFYGKIQALRGVDIDVNPGEIVTLIGSNGAGKTTLMMTICGKPQARNGSIRFDGHDITRRSTHEIMHLSIAQSPEGRRIFPRMTVFENLQMGAILNHDRERTFDQDLQRAFTLFPILKKRENQRGGTLSGGEQQMLSIARALMGRPRLLLLDEPSLGLAPLIVKQIFDTIRELNRTEGLTIFLVEQNAFHALKLALSGTGRELLARDEVRKAYLEGGH
jgi:branched-chain amino acid transport system ATP-binding protein